MNLDELKTAWQQYDRRLQSAYLINEKILLNMIAERSGARFLKVKRNYMVGFAWMSACLLFGIAVMAGNPFDYILAVQYLPIAVYCICITVLITAMLNYYMGLQSVAIGHDNLEASLKQIIAVYERPGKYVKYTWMIFIFTQIFLFPISFLPRIIKHIGLWPALGVQLICFVLGVLVFFVARKLGAFKERTGKKFKDDLDELKELKNISAELVAGD